MILLWIVAGHETTVNLIASGMLALLQHPDQLERLRNDPTLIKTAVEELLRFTAPVETATERFAREDLELAGVKIAHGDLVLAAIASANRDERQFQNPDALDIAREPNRHLAFGQGIHFCLGASLARLEGQTAINTLLAGTRDLQLAVDPTALRWRSGLVLRGSLRASQSHFRPQLQWRRGRNWRRPIAFRAFSEQIGRTVACELRDRPLMRKRRARGKRPAEAARANVGGSFCAETLAGET